MGTTKLLAFLLVPAYVVLIAVLDTLQIQAVFDPPLLLLALNTLFLGIVPVAVAYMAARVYLKAGSSSILLTGCGMLVFGLCTIPAAWVIGMPGGPNMTVTMHNTGSLVGAFFLALGSILNLFGRMSPDHGEKGKQRIATAYGCVCIFVVIYTFATVKGLVPSFFVQDVGPTLLRQVVLATAVIFFVLSSAFSMHTYAKWKSDFLYWYSLGLILIGIGLCAVFLQTAVGSPIGWLGRSAQYLGGSLVLVAIATAWRSARHKRLPIERVIANFLADAEANYRDLVETARDAIISFDHDGRIIGWNYAAETMFGHSKADVIGSLFSDLLIPEQQASVFKAEIGAIVAQPKKSLSTKSLEIEGQRRNGSLFPIEVSVSVRELPTGRVTTCIIRDVAKRKRGEQTLREREERLRRISSMISDIAYSCTKLPSGSYSIDWLTGGAERLTGYSVDDLKSLGCWRSLVLDEDLPVFDNDVIGLAPGTKGSCELRLRHKTGGIVRIASFAECFADAAFPDSLRLYGAWVDITERTLAEEALRESEEKYRLIFSHEKDAIVLSDAHTITVLDANESAEKLWGYSREELLGMRVPRLSAEPVNTGEALAGATQRGGYEVSARRLRKKDGTQFLAEISANPFALDGRPVVCSIVRDITGRKKAEEDLRQSEEKYRSIFDNSIEGIFQSAPEGRLITVNPAYARMFGYTSPDEMISEVTDIASQLYANPAEREEVQRCFRDPAPLTNYEVECLRKDGTHFWVSFNASAVRDESGRILYYEGITEDVTARRQMEDAFRKSEALLKEAQRVAHIGHWELDSPAGTPKWSEEISHILGLDPSGGEPSFAEMQHILHPDDWDFLNGRIIRGSSQGVPFDIEVRCIRPDQSIRWVNAKGYPTAKGDGESFRMFGTVQDITDRKQLDQALLASETRYRRLFEAAKDGILILDAVTAQIVDVNPFLAELLGYSREEMLEKKLWEIGLFEDTAKSQAVFAELQSKEYVRYEDLSLQTVGGEVINVEFVSNVYSVNGTKVIQCNIRDITERRRTEQALRESEEKYRTLFEDSTDALFIVPADGTLLDANQAYFDLLGYEKEEIVGQSVLKTYADPADRPRYLEALVAKGFVRDYPVRLVEKDGRQIDCLISSRIERDKDGNILSSRGFIRDITEQKNLQRQLLQAQKMEAIGTLTGGIAHDFNNILTVVLGFSDLLLAEKDEKDPDYEDLRKILRAGKNGAELVQRLLMFSRKSEPKPIPMNLNKQMMQVEKLLRRTIPRMIEIQLGLSADLPEINADPSQIEQILLNLAVNARDSMPDSGKLTLKTEAVSLDEEYCRLHVEATPGEYVLLSVSDSGHGMDKETLQHIFEPFFTTKEMGRGTGLGLAMVYGIVKQHAGHITCYSEVGEGTTFRVYLPAIEGEAETDVETTAIMPAFGTETVLLVDDEDLVRDLGARILTKHGYTVLKAADGREALDVFGKERSRISLVILDLIMPQMGGKECLKEILRIDPQMKVLVASGFSADTSIKESIQMGAKGFVNKPFRVNELLRGVRKVLDEG